MRLRIQTNKNGSQNFYVLKSYRDENGKSTTKIYEKLGTYEYLSSLHDDPVTWAKNYVEELNKAENDAESIVNISLSEKIRVEKDSTRLYSAGYLYLQKIYHQLRLDYVCNRITAKHSFDYSLNKIFQVLLYGRILFPTSKLGTLEYASSLLEKSDIQLHQIYRSLSVLAEESDFIQSQLYKFSNELGKRNDKILYYDCTNYYFEIESESGIRQYGVSKENRPNPIVEMGMFMDADGIPLAFCIHPGNTNEQTTMIPLEQQLLKDFELSRFITCTDSGLASVKNRVFNTKGGRAFITTQSIKKMNKEQKEWALSADNWYLCGAKGTEAKKKFNLDEILASEELCAFYHDKIFYKESWFKNKDIDQKIIVSFSIKYRNYMRNIREQQIERARKAISNSSSVNRSRQTDYKRFISSVSSTPNGEVAESTTYFLNEETIKNEEIFDGFYAVATDLEDSPEEIIAVNKRRWEIEECFRIMKTEFSARPVYLSRDDRIKAHFLICFISLVMYRYLERALESKFTCPQILEALSNMNVLKVSEDGYIPTFTRTDLTDLLQEKYQLNLDSQIISKNTMRKIIAKTKER